MHLTENSLMTLTLYCKGMNQMHSCQPLKNRMRDTWAKRWGHVHFCMAMPTISAQCHPPRQLILELYRPNHGSILRLCLCHIPLVQLRSDIMISAEGEFGQEQDISNIFETVDNYDDVTDSWDCPSFLDTSIKVVVK